MEIEVKETENCISISVSGDIELMSIRNFKDRLFNASQNSNKDIELDLSGVDYIDSSGVGVLISLLKLQKKKEKSMAITSVSPKVMNVLKLSSLDEIFRL